MTAHSAQLTKMRLPDRAIMLKAVSKAKNPILVKRKKMFKLGLARDSFFHSICDSLYLCSKTPLNPRLFTAVLPKRLYYYVRHIHHAFMIIFETSHTGLIMASLNVLVKLLPSSPFRVSPCFFIGVRGVLSVSCFYFHLPQFLGICSR